MGMAWIVCEIIEHLLFSWLRSAWPWTEINPWFIFMSNFHANTHACMHKHTHIHNHASMHALTHTYHTDSRSSTLNNFKVVYDFENKKNTTKCEAKNLVIVWFDFCSFSLLSQRINEKQQVINEYESGRAIPNNQVMGKLERAIGEYDSFIGAWIDWPTLRLTSR